MSDIGDKFFTIGTREALICILPLLIHSSINQHLGSFHLLVIANNTSMNMVYKNFLSSYVQLIGFRSRNKIAGSYGNSFHTVHRILKARILKWFAIPFSSGPHFVRTLHHDPLILGDPTWCNSVSLSKIRLWSMWLDWLVFCDCGFQSVRPLMEKDKRLMEASWWQRLTVGETGFCSDRRGHAQ